MAKSLEENTILFDGAAQEYTGWWKVEQIIYRGATTGGHSIKLTDSADNEICTITAHSSGMDIPRRLDGKWCDGLKVASLDSGTAEIHVK